MVSDLTIYRGNSMVLDLVQLWNSLTDTLLTGATVEVTITDPAGVNLPGVTFPIAAGEIAPGDYQAKIPAALDTSGSRYGFTLIDISHADVRGTIRQRTWFSDRLFKDTGR